MKRTVEEVKAEIQKRIEEYKKIMANIDANPESFYGDAKTLKREYEVKIHVCEWTLGLMN